MSIYNQIQRIKNNIAMAYAKLEDKGAIIPANENSANLPETIESLPLAGESGGAGDVVLAVNNTGEEEISSGRQVVLNRMVNVEDAVYELQRVGGEPRISFYLGDILIHNKHKYVYNKKYNFWIINQYHNLDLYTYPVDFIEGKPVYHRPYCRDNYNCCTVAGIDEQKSIVNGFIWIGGGFCVGNNNGKMAVYRFNYQNNTADTSEVLIATNTYNLTGNSTVRFIYADGKIMVQDTGRIRFFNAEDCSLIQTVAFSHQYVYYITGNNVGDYVFACNSLYVDRWNGDGGIISIYQIKEGYLLESVNVDVLAPLTMYKTSMIYNIETGILQVGTFENLGAHIYQFDKQLKTWSEITPQIDFKKYTDITSYPPIIALNLAKNMCVYTYYTTHSWQQRARLFGHKLIMKSKDWVADLPQEQNIIPSQTITGYTTGGGEDDKIEVATKLPPKCFLTLNITPDCEDGIEFIGEV